MPRPHRTCPVDLPVHVIQRGNNRQPCFAGNTDFQAYANWLREGALKYGLDIHGWVFMTNHVHLLVTPRKEMAVSRCIQYLGRHYVRYFNIHHGRTGTLYEGRFKSSIVQTRPYLLACLRYIELNPVRAGMVDHPSDYPWSSYSAHAYGVRPRMWRPHPEYLALGSDQARRTAAYRKLVQSAMDEDLISEIRHASRANQVLGNESFKEEIERLTGQRQTHLKRGPKPQSNPRTSD